MILKTQVADELNALIYRLYNLTAAGKSPSARRGGIWCDMPQEVRIRGRVFACRWSERI